MRVNFIGNTCNNHYVLARYLRELGVDAHLYYNGKAALQCWPQSEDPELEQEPAPWVHTYRHPEKPFLPLNVVAPALLRELADCDLLHVHGEGLLLAVKTGRPFIWHPFGSDFFHLPFYDSWLFINKFGRKILDLRNLLAPLFFRKAMAQAAAIVLGVYNRLWIPGYRLLHRLHLEDRIVHLHLGINTRRFSPPKAGARSRLRAQMLPEARENDLVIFHPTRQAFTSSYTDSKKGNDRLYRALARLQAQGQAFYLVLVAQGYPDEAPARDLISSLGIGDSVKWIHHLPRHQLVDWYALADLTADHFVAGALGSIPLESMACGTPVLTFMQTESNSDYFYPPTALFPELPPVINASSEEEIFRALDHYARNREELGELGLQGRTWVEQNAAGEVVARRYLGLYESILARRPHHVNKATLV